MCEFTDLFFSITVRKIDGHSVNKTLGMTYSKRLPSELRKQMNLIKERENDWDVVHDGSRALARVGMWGKWNTVHADWRVDHAISNQNRSVFMDLRKTLPRDFWRDEGITSALSTMILYGMYAWMIELHDQELNIGYSTNYDLFSDAFCVRDPIVLELLFKWDMYLYRKSITNAMCWVPCRSLFPGSMPGFESPEAEKEFVIEANREIVDLLRPLAVTYIHRMDTGCLQVDLDPQLYGHDRLPG